jgi:hypothetical protein
MIFLYTATNRSTGESHLLKRGSRPSTAAAAKMVVKALTQEDPGSDIHSHSP